MVRATLVDVIVSFAWRAMLTSALACVGIAACSSVAGIELSDQGLDRFTAGEMDTASGEDGGGVSAADPEDSSDEPGTDDGTAGPPDMTGLGGGSTDGGSSTGDGPDGTGSDGTGSDTTGADGGTSGDPEASTGGSDGGPGDPNEPRPEPSPGSTGGEPPDVGTTGT
jgi:hypothetical protein